MMATAKAAENLGANQVSGVTSEQIEQAAQFEQRFGPTAPVTAKQALGPEALGGELQDVANRIERIADFVESEGYALRHGIDGIPERPVREDIEISLEEAMHRYRDSVTDQSQATPKNVAEYEQANSISNGLRMQFNADTDAIRKVTAQKLPAPISESEVQITQPNKAQEQKQTYSREDLIRQLRAFTQKKAKEQKKRGYNYISAEAAIAANLANQLEAGAKRIDLSQHYATDDPAAAQERHDKALQILAPVLREAEKQTESLSYGQALAHGKGEVLAVQQLNRGLVNAKGLLQKASHHNNHQAQAPRLSMSSDGGL